MVAGNFPAPKFQHSVAEEMFKTKVLKSENHNKLLDYFEA